MRGRLPLLLLSCALHPALRAERVAAEALPDPQVPEFRFPEAEARLTRWITVATRADDAAAAAKATVNLYTHGWGLWTALTMETKQVVAGQRLRVFETWYTTDELATADSPAGTAALDRFPRTRGSLAVPTQLARRDEPLEAEEEAARQRDDSRAGRVLGFTKFNRAAAEHILRQQLLDASALDTLLIAGAQQITPFPVDAVAAKPLFQIAKADRLVDGRYFPVKVWSGPPGTPQPWSPAQWPSSVWIDVREGGTGRGAVDEIAAPDGSSRRSETTYPLSSLISYRLSAADAVALNANQAGADARAGDIAYLVAMHVATREIARWTWQTFWWTPASDDPPAPSSRQIADSRPAELQGAARHYAMAQAYAMLSPDQPYIGGSNDGAVVYAYNPWLEARLGPAELPDSQPGIGPDGTPAANNLGVQSNCMSCHARATYNPQRIAHAPRPAAARYVDLADPQFVGTLQVDFLWSIGRHARQP